LAAETGTESTPSYRNEDDLTLCEYVIGVLALSFFVYTELLEDSSDNSRTMA
jgi:hypothetical protein